MPFSHSCLFVAGLGLAAERQGSLERVPRPYCGMYHQTRYGDQTRPHAMVVLEYFTSSLIIIKSALNFNVNLVHFSILSKPDVICRLPFVRCVNVNPNGSPARRIARLSIVSSFLSQLPSALSRTSQNGGIDTCRLVGPFGLSQLWHALQAGHFHQSAISQLDAPSRIVSRCWSIRHSAYDDRAAMAALRCSGPTDPILASDCDRQTHVARLRSSALGSPNQYLLRGSY